MAVLGYNVKGASNLGAGVGRMYVSRFTLATPGTLTELHGWFKGGSGANSIRVVIYKHVSGSDPQTASRVAYTNLLPLTGADVELSQTGFSVALVAADYYIGYLAPAVGFGCGDSAGSGYWRSNSATDPPQDPFGNGGLSTSATQVSCWAVYTPGAATVKSGFLGFM